MTKCAAIGIDLGGTTIKGVLIDQLGNILEKLFSETLDDPENKSDSWKSNVRNVAFSLLKKAGNPSNLPIGLSAPGLTDPTNRAIAFMPGRLQGLENLLWSEYLGEKDVFVLNDAKAALLAESKYGAGKGFKDIMLLTLGTGVGGALLINGQLHNGFLHRAGHLGHISLDGHAPTGILDLPGTLEYFVGNATILERSGGLYHATSELVTDFLSGRQVAAKIWLDSIERLAIGLSSLINVISPEVIILGGGIVKAGSALFEPLELQMERFEWRPNGVRTPILEAAFSQFAGAVGSATFAYDQSKI